MNILDRAVINYDKHFGLPLEFKQRVFDYVPKCKSCHLGTDPDMKQIGMEDAMCKCKKRRKKRGRL